MKFGIVGMGCVTPLGANPTDVWRAIEVSRRAPTVEIQNPESGRKHLGIVVPPEYTAPLSREARLRRSSTISLLAATAAKAAIDSSGLSLDAASKQRMAVVFGVSSGGVQYTRRFYEQVVKQGANSASPLLFPETVYNAPASHVAAMLGVDGATYTLVGDGTIGLQALAFGGQLLALGEADHVLVVAAEELDWILLEAHRDWRLTTDGRRRGALLGEGAAAVVLANGKAGSSVRVCAGHTFLSRAEASAAITAALADFGTAGAIDLIVSGGNDTWADKVIAQAVAKSGNADKGRLIAPKRYLGEALGAGALIQVVVAAAALAELQRKRALVACLGWNQQAAAALVEREVIEG